MKNILYSLLFSLSLFACSKDDGHDNGGNNDGYPSDLTGTIYYKWATEGILRVTFPSATGGSFIEDDTRLNSFDVSRDGQYRLTAVNASTVGNNDVRFTLSNSESGSVVHEFIYDSPAGNSYCGGQLSPDNTLILVESNDVEDGITILKTDGEFVLRLDGIGGEPFSMHDMKMWLPGNEILLTHGKNIIRIPPPYNSGSLVKEMNYEDWGDLTVNHQGTQLAMRIGNHIHTMDIDGNNLKQVTTSNFKESKPVFSPDGKYLMVGGNYRQSSVMGHSWDIKIIPNNGEQYNVDPLETNSTGVIPVIWNGKDKIETGSGQVIWK
ncbi:PD40 domain-containing protein [Olivibacter sitiensis]|uniref:PD40 domain-containing protein n=1 Tax=Olivibacter sitiensis TaxID=376470 RepID=UPI000401DE7B|nr:PD40 domain-containing protein [Olivibacter sitiensis]